jgi:tetratricopeptide (TPR) repeat protein
MTNLSRVLFLVLIPTWSVSVAGQLAVPAYDEQHPQEQGLAAEETPEGEHLSSAAELERRVDSLAIQGRLDDAEDLVREALQMYPDHEGLQASAAVIDFLRAVASGTELMAAPVEADPDAASANKNADSTLVATPPEAVLLERRVDTLIQRGRLDEAQKLLDRALTEFPDYRGLQASQSWLSFRKTLKTWGSRTVWTVGSLVGAFVLLTLVLHKRSPLTAASIYVFGIYVFVLPAALLIAVLGAGIAAMAKSDHLPGSYIQHVAMVVFSCFLGAVGGAIDSSVIIANRERYSIPRDGRFAYFFFKPLNGFYLAGAMYFALLAGHIAVFEGAASTPTTWTVGLLATLTGIFSENALEKLRQVSSSLFGSSEQGRTPRDTGGVLQTAAVTSDEQVPNLDAATIPEQDAYVPAAVA